MTGSSLFVRPTDVDRVVAVRMARARRLVDDVNPLQLHAVITDAALHLTVGDEATRRSQIDHLMALARRPNVTIQLLRSEHGFHDAHRGHFVLLGFNEVRSLAYTETIDNALYVQDPEQVHHYELVAGQLGALASEPDESLELLSERLHSIS